MVLVSTATAESVLQAIQARLQAEIAGIHISQQIDAVTADPRGLAHLGTAVLRISDEVLGEYPTRLQGVVRVLDTIELQTAYKVDPRDQLTGRDALLARGRAIRIALTATAWGGIDTRRVVYTGSTGPVRHPASAEWLVLVQAFTFSRFAELG